MKMFLISDNVDTLTGMRLAGVEGYDDYEYPGASDRTGDHRRRIV